jgi:hypothetical protein
MGVSPVVFNYATWLLFFPELSGITSEVLYSPDPSDGIAVGFFPTATMYIRNDGAGPVNDPAMQKNLLYYATAHVAFLRSPRTNGVPTTGGTEPPLPIVGRIASATEGSVSLTAEMAGLPASAAWWNQDPYGAAVWDMLKPLRTMRYVPSPRRLYNPPVWRGGLGRGW